MQPKDILDIIVFAAAIATAITVGRTNIKKQTIADLMTLVEVHQLTITELKDENREQAALISQQNNKIVYLEGVVYGNSKLVQGGSVARSPGPGSGNSPANPKTSKNRNP